MNVETLGLTLYLMRAAVRFRRKGGGNGPGKIAKAVLAPLVAQGTDLGGDGWKASPGALRAGGISRPREEQPEGRPNPIIRPCGAVEVLPPFNIRYSPL